MRVIRRNRPADATGTPAIPPERPVPSIGGAIAVVYRSRTREPPKNPGFLMSPPIRDTDPLQDAPGRRIDRLKPRRRRRPSRGALGWRRGEQPPAPGPPRSAERLVAVVREVGGLPLPPEQLLDGRGLGQGRPAAVQLGRGELAL